MDWGQTTTAADSHTAQAYATTTTETHATATAVAALAGSGRITQCDSPDRGRKTGRVNRIPGFDRPDQLVGRPHARCDGIRVASFAASPGGPRRRA